MPGRGRGRERLDGCRGLGPSPIVDTRPNTSRKRRWRRRRIEEYGAATWSRPGSGARASVSRAFRNPDEPQPPAKGGGRCTIKGNIGKSGTRIYHVPGGRFYDRTRIDTSKGERWFLHRGRGPGGRVAALAPVGHLPVHAPNRSDSLIPHPQERGLQHAGSWPTTGVPQGDCGPGRHGVVFIVRPGESSWLLPDGPTGQADRGARLLP